jgi:ArsR family transcriptional regulator
MEKVITIAKALSDSNRLRALMALRKGELCVCHLIELLSLAPSTVSKHMSILKQAGLVKCRKDSRWVYYSLVNNEISPLIKDALNLILTNLDKDPVINTDKKRVKKITCQ